MSASVGLPFLPPRLAVAQIRRADEEAHETGPSCGLEKRWNFSLGLPTIPTLNIDDWLKGSPMGPWRTIPMPGNKSCNSKRLVVVPPSMGRIRFDCIGERLFDFHSMKSTTLLENLFLTSGCPLRPFMYNWE